MFEINKWDDRFETAHTRKRQRLGWYLAPSGNDSKGYRKLMRSGKDGIIALGVFSALCQYTATLPKELRGKLCNSDSSPMDIEDISEITRMEVADIRHASGMLVACGWLALMDKGICHDVPPICHSSATSVPTLPKEKEKEKNQGEGEGEVMAKASPSKKFIKPTSSQVLEYGRTLTPPFAESENFVDFYESKGWVVGKNKMKCWKSAVRTWNRKNDPKQQQQKEIKYGV